MSAKAKKSWLAFLIFYASYMSLYRVRYHFSAALAVLESGGVLSKAQIGFIGSIALCASMMDVLVYGGAGVGSLVILEVAEKHKKSLEAKRFKAFSHPA